MNIHLFLSDEVDSKKLLHVVDYLGRFPGPLKFISHEETTTVPGDELYDEFWEGDRILIQQELLECPKTLYKTFASVARWPSLFDRCRVFRKSNSIPADEPVVLLTDLRNDRNWFSAGDSGKQSNYFIQTDLWEWYVDGDPRFPIAYELIALPLRILMFGSFSDMADKMHRPSRGCLNDFCQDKREIGYKLRSADICPECLKLLHDKNVDPMLVQQAFRIMDDIRSQLLFRERYVITRKPSGINIAGLNRRILLSDLGDLEIHFTPLEKTVYLFFLNHPEGVEFSYMPDYARENRVNALCTNKDDCLSQVISRIRRKFEEALGAEMAAPYLIAGDSGQKRKIELDRNLVRVDESKKVTYEKRIIIIVLLLSAGATGVFAQQVKSSMIPGFGFQSLPRIAHLNNRLKSQVLHSP
jgi:hypothetical protein